MFYDESLTHHGILGMKWGIRRYQNKDGSLTRAGAKRVAKRNAEKELLDDAKKRTTEKEAARKAHLNPLTVTKKDMIKMSDDELASLAKRITAMSIVKDKQATLIKKPEKTVVQNALESYSKNIIDATSKELSTKVVDKLKPSIDTLVEKLAEKVKITK